MRAVPVHRAGFPRSLALAIATVPAAAGERMNAEDLEQALSPASRSTASIANGDLLLRELQCEDGTIRYHDPDRRGFSGEWSGSETGASAPSMKAPQGACFFVERDGANCFTFTAAEEKDGRPVPQKDWASRGWDRTKPSTCPTAPEIQL